MVVHPVGAIIGEPPRVDQLALGRLTSGNVARIDGRGSCGSQQEELAPVYPLGLIFSIIALHLPTLILKHQAGDHTPMRVVTGGCVKGEHESDSESWLYPANGFQVCSEAEIRSQAALTAIV